MSQDRRLIDSIKGHFLRKSSAHLREIVKSGSPARWSPEAITAAEEVLYERLIDRADEPEVPEEDPPDPQPMPGGSSMAFLALSLLGGLSGHVHVHVPVAHDADEPDPDWPEPFGPRIAWLALESTDTQAVAAALELSETQATTWAEGVEAAYQGSVFVTPPVGDWTLAVSTAFLPLAFAKVPLKALLERLSRAFGEAQYFCTHADIELHAWSRACEGRLVRGCGWLGQMQLTLWNEGEPTPEECQLGLQPSAWRSASTEKPPSQSVMLPDESCLMQLASLWSIDPTTLNIQYKEPGQGLRGQTAIRPEWDMGSP